MNSTEAQTSVQNRKPSKETSGCKSYKQLKHILIKQLYNKPFNKKENGHKIAKTLTKTTTAKQEIKHST